MEQNKEYFVFISYSSLDNEWAIWLRHELEHYHLPASFNGRTDVRDNLRKVFRDRDELSAGPEWDEQVQKALEDTNNLIVICSPHSAKSEAVNKEVETFIALGKEDHIFPFIVEGDKPEDCFPPALRHSKLGGDVNKDGGRDSAFIKVVAGMLKVSFPSLWNRYEIEKAEEERKQREQRDKLYMFQSRFLANKVLQLIDEGDVTTAKRLAIEALPVDINNPNRPYLPEAEHALRSAVSYRYEIIFKPGITRIDGLEGSVEGWEYYEDDKENFIMQTDFDKEHKMFAAVLKDSRIYVWNYENGKVLFEYISRYNNNDSFLCARFCNSGKYLAIISNDSNDVVLFDIMNGSEIKRLNGNDVIEISHNGRYLITVDTNDIFIWDTFDLSLLREYRGHTGKIKCVKFTPDDQQIVYITDEYDLSVRNICKDTINSNSGSDDYESIDVLPDGETLLINTSYNDYYYCNIKTWDTSNSFNIESTFCGCFNNLLLTINKDNTISILNGNKREPINKLYGHNDKINYASFNIDGTKVISCSNDKTIRIWDVYSGNCIKVISGHHQKINFSTFSPCMNYIVSSSIDGEIRIWDLRNDKLTINDVNKDNIAFSKDDNILVAHHNNKVFIWDLSHNKLIREIDGKPIGFNQCDQHFYVYCGKNIIDCDLSYGGITSIAMPFANTIISAFFCENKYWDYQQTHICLTDGLNMCIVNTTNNRIEYSFQHDSKTNMNFFIIPLIECIISEDEYSYYVWNLKSNKLLNKFKKDKDVTLFYSNSNEYIIVCQEDLCRLYNKEEKNIYSTSTKMLYDWRNYRVPRDYVTGYHIHKIEDEEGAGINGLWREREKCDSKTKMALSPTGKYLICELHNKIDIDYFQLQHIINETRKRFKDRPLDLEERKKYYFD